MPKHNFKDLTNKTFGRLTVLRRSSDVSSRHTRWDCTCSCGGKTTVFSTNLMTGDTQSCGCLVVDTHSTHGKSGSKAYNAWQHVIGRCTRPRSTGYANYGGRGVDVCVEWLRSFENFYSDMGDPPTEDHSIDRKDNERGYCKENCRWATRTEQANNKRSNVRLCHKGVTKTLAQWSRETGLSYSLLWGRHKKGWSAEMTLSTEAGGSQNLFPPINYNGVTLTVAQWADRLGIPYEALRGRFRRGWNTKKALTEPVKRR